MMMAFKMGGRGQIRTETQRKHLKLIADEIMWRDIKIIAITIAACAPTGAYEAILQAYIQSSERKLGKNDIVRSG